MDCISAAESPNVIAPAGAEIFLFWPLMRNAMKFIAPLVAICALSQAAIAQTSDCKSIAARKDRLACHDNASQAAKSTTSPAAAQPAASGYVDAISAEDARMNARLKNICRGC
jgi:hypothetical protein